MPRFFLEGESDDDEDADLLNDDNDDIIDNNGSNGAEPVLFEVGKINR